MPHRAMTSSRSPSPLLRTIGASWSGKILGNDSPPNPSLRPFTGCRGAILADEKSAARNTTPATCSARSFNEKPKLYQLKSTIDRFKQLRIPPK
jgi:hypothetical protein